MRKTWEKAARRADHEPRPYPTAVDGGGQEPLDAAEMDGTQIRRQLVEVRGGIAEAAGL